MRRWLALVAVGFALAAVWALPPQVLELVDRPERTHELRRLEALQRDLSDSYETLQRLRWADSLSALVARSPRGAPLVLAPATVDEADLAALRELWARLERELEPRDPDVVLAYAFQPRAAGGGIVGGGDPRLRTETYLGSRDGVDYCLRVLVTRNADMRVRNQLDELRSGRGWESALGACRLVARHGLPGAGVRRWLEWGGASYAVLDAAPTEIEPATVRFGRRFVFGSYVLGGIATLEVDRCLAGRGDACAAVFLDPAVAEPSIGRDREAARRASALSIRDVPATFLGEGVYLLADLERQFGADDFARFWRAESDVEAAFRNAFGVDVGTWIVAWAGATIGVDPPGPQLAGSGSTLPIVLTLALFAAIAIARVRKHTVA